MKTKKRRLIEDWFRVLHWFVRLRRAAKGRTPYSLLELELKMQKVPQDVRAAASKARIDGYQFGVDSDAEEE